MHVLLLLACSSDSLEELKEVEVVPPTFGDETPPGDAVWELDAASDPSLAFTAWGMGNSEQHGTWSAYNVRVVRSGPAITDLSVDFVVDLDTVVTGNSQMERHLRNDDFFDVPNHPTGTFASRSIEAIDDQTFTVTGDLTLRGTTRSITWEATIAEQGARITSRATMEFSRFEFGLHEAGMTEPGGDGIADRVVLTYDVTLTPRDP